MPADPMHATASAAQFLGLAPRTLVNMRHRGGGPEFCKYETGAVRYKESELVRWRDQQRFTRTPAPARRRAS